MKQPNSSPPDELCTREELADRYFPLVASLAARYAPDEYWRLELISEGLCALLEAYDRFDRTRGVGFAAYASFRVRGAMLDLLRREMRHADRVVELEHALSAAVEPEETDYRLELVRAALDRLDQRDRRIIEAILLEGLTQREVAAELGVSPPRINQLYHRALKRLREETRRLAPTWLKPELQL